jgi:probable HAF family extracellular repeat protein
MLRLGLSSPVTRALRRLFHGASPNRRARRAMRRNRASSRLTLEHLESRELLSSYIVEDLGAVGPTGSGPEGAAAINAKGEIAGTSHIANNVIHAFLWEPGKAGQDLGSLGGANTNSAGFGINILGQVVGDTTTASLEAHPFIFQPGGSMTDLQDALPQSLKDFGDSLLNARGISDTGVIVGKGSFNLIDLVTTGPYSFDPPSGTLNLLDSTAAGSQAAAVAGTKVVSNLRKNGSSIETQAVVEDVNTPDSSILLPAIPDQEWNEVFGISAPNSSGAQFAVGDATDTSNHSHLVLWTIPTDSHSATVLDLSSPSLFGYLGLAQVQ